MAVYKAAASKKPAGLSQPRYLLGVMLRIIPPIERKPMGQACRLFLPLRSATLASFIWTRTGEIEESRRLLITGADDQGIDVSDRVGKHKPKRRACGT